jgi:hypothetical protein
LTTLTGESELSGTEALLLGGLRALVFEILDRESITAAQAAPQATPPAPVPAATGEPAGAECEQPVQPAG